MEFEIEEFAFEAWLSEDGEAAGANHPPAWCRDRTDNAQTGLWIPEEGRALTAKRLEPAD
ncbi:MAG: hypothetical protein LC648_09815 [Novosphingobium sp.]|nr:hypothetical protein [Novosphingobium sp.]